MKRISSKELIHILKKITTSRLIFLIKNFARTFWKATTIATIMIKISPRLGIINFPFVVSRNAPISMTIIATISCLLGNSLSMRNMKMGTKSGVRRTRKPAFIAEVNFCPKMNMKIPAAEVKAINQSPNLLLDSCIDSFIRGKKKPREMITTIMLREKMKGMASAPLLKAAFCTII